MNTVERALIHALFVHLHHNIDKAIDFEAIAELNQEVSKLWPDVLVVGPGDDAAVIHIPGIEGCLVVKMESHCSPCVPNPYDAAHTCVDGNLRDIVAMGGRPIALLNFVGTRPLHEKVLVGPCGFDGVCKCGECKEMTSKERLDLIMKAIRDACETMGVLIVGGGFSTSFSDIVPAVVGATIGKLVTKEPLTKPAKAAGDRIILIGETGNDGNDTLFRAGLVSEMRPAVPVFEKERITMEATLAALETGKVHACSDLGAAGIGAGICESARYGGLGARVDLEKVPVKVQPITPPEILICESQGRMVIQVPPEHVAEILEAIKAKGGIGTVIGEITNDDKEVFMYGKETVAVIPNNPSKEILDSLKGGV